MICYVLFSEHSHSVMFALAHLGVQDINGTLPFRAALSAVAVLKYLDCLKAPAHLLEGVCLLRP